MLFNHLTAEDKQQIVTGERDSELWQQFPFYSLDAPAMPPAGNNFIKHAEATGEHVAQLYFEALYNGYGFCIPVSFKDQAEPARIIPGHFWGHNTYGPQLAADAERPIVMVVGKMPGYEELDSGRNFYGPSGQQLYSTLIGVGMDEAKLGDWYLCNLVRWPHLSPQGGALPQAWIKDCLPILYQELRILKPEYILCLGAEATKAICGKAASLQSMIGRHIDFTYVVNHMDEEPAEHTAKVMAVVHPASVLRNTDQYPQFESTLRNFVELVNGRQISRHSDTVRIRYVYKERELADIVDKIIKPTGLKKVAVDAEWHGEHPDEPGAYLRTVQFSAADNEAVVIVLRYKGGGQAFMPGDYAAIRQLARLLDRDDVQIIGHFFAADMPWLLHAGLDLRPRFTVPADINAMRTGEYAGGFDTSLAAHAHNETAEYKLELLASRMLGADRWDIELQNWLKGFCTANKLKVGDIEGYGECPEEVLLPYSGKDAAYTRKLRDIYAGVPGNADKPGLLNGDRYGNDCWVPFQISMKAFRAFLEMHTIGVKVDRTRIDNLTTTFEAARNRLLAKFRASIDWPAFNPRSSPQCVELLFGEQFNRKLDKITGQPVRLRPAGAKCFGLRPVKTTGTRSKPWAKVQAEGEEYKYSPSTDKETCGILASHHSEVRALRDLRLIDQVLKSVFRPAKRQKNGQLIVEDGHHVYDGGIAAFICHDSRIRSFFSQHKETGRASSRRPPLQNLSKRRENDYKRILQDNYAYKIRSFICSNTDPDYGPTTVLIEADFQGAELFGMATQARDNTMIDHCLRAALPEDHPNHYDIHSNVAVRAFNLDCEPTKSGLESIDRVDLRVGAKNVIFGGGYGRSAEAIARQAQEEGVDMTEEQAERIMHAIFDIYSGIPILQQGLRERASNPGWIRNCFGRLRRVIASNDRVVQGELERQFLNFPFQSMVADAVSLALDNLYTDSRRERLGYRIVLQLHDAIMLEVPVESLVEVYDEVLPDCMEQQVSFKSCDFDGRPYADSPDYHFSIDRDVMLRWGEKIDIELCQELRIPERFGTV